MKKAARITGIVLGCVFLIICALPFVGAAVNIADGHIRADRAEKLISDMGGEICDSFVYTGNTSGTGNHTENQLLFIVRTNVPMDIPVSYTHLTLPTILLV